MSIGFHRYRAPELCGSFFAKYTPAIDIWSIGCIFAEVLLGKPLFAGRNVVHQLELITDLLGSPSADVINKVLVACCHLHDYCVFPATTFGGASWLCFLCHEDEWGLSYWQSQGMIECVTIVVHVGPCH